MRLEGLVFALWAGLGLLLAIAAGGWWWFMPHGFPPEHPRFFVNTILPWLGIVVGLVLAGGATQGSTTIARPLGVGFAAVLVGGAMALRTFFPVSAGTLWLGLVAAGLTLGASLWLVPRGERHGRAATVAALVLGMGTGALLTWSQGGEAPSTTPLNLAYVKEQGGVPGPLERFELDHAVTINPYRGHVDTTVGNLALRIDPLLSFESRSPDRFWVLFAAPEAQLVGTRTTSRVHLNQGTARIEYKGPEPATLKVWSSQDTVHIEAQSEVRVPVYSHLNTYLRLTVKGHSRLALAFSTSPEVAIDVLPLDYPVGRPARFAYRTAEGRFVVAQATDAEKGPFRVLADGVLPPDAPLVLTLLDEGVPRADIVLRDWAAQASTALSPTAGWKVPVNAIEFSLTHDAPHSAAEIYVTLASTSVGRGFDSVGHSAGRYANRIEIRPRP